MGLDLGNGIERNTHRNEERGAAKIERHAESSYQNLRNDAHQSKIYTAHKRQPGKDAVEVLRRFLAGSYPGDIPSVFLQVIGYVYGVEYYRGIEIRKEEKSLGHMADSVSQRFLAGLGKSKQNDAVSNWPNGSKQ